MLSIHNSQTKQKETFKPIHSGKVNMYVCGITVYDLCHIGHARSMLSFDIAYRYLTFLGYEVNYVRNITDIDDKIIKRANENKEEMKVLTERMITAMNEDFSALGILPPNQQPRATHSIPSIINMITNLIEKGFAYQGKEGDVYYAVHQFADYGKLSKRNLEDLRAGERIAVADDKRDPLDFVLWKQSKAHEPSWDSPWGKGRPGWHIECSAMSSDCLHNEIDIHGGGMDLMFPHHENEIAQSEAASGKHFVNYWMHVGFLQINDEKMSKSLGNFLTIRDVLKKVSGEMLRYFILTTHYRSPFNYSEQSLLEAHAALERFYVALRGLPAVEALPEESNYNLRFKTAMNDDFNTPEALAVLFDLAREINRQRSEDLNLAAQLAALLKKLAGVLGILQQDPEKFLQAGFSQLDDSLADGLSAAAIEALITKRQQARAEKNWAESDRLRDELLAQGIILEDKAGQTSWRRG